ncbi:unnamed protein product [Rodentolepis nana]|uniref:Ovule protein n=1 Tax=Rodentolepis nana TaxID=102285 RepID=A0A0R3TYT7_RODNA|nr:unnamed protein product [Rodentolepis nana]
MDTIPKILVPLSTPILLRHISYLHSPFLLTHPSFNQIPSLHFLTLLFTLFFLLLPPPTPPTSSSLHKSAFHSQNYLMHMCHRHCHYQLRIPPSTDRGPRPHIPQLNQSPQLPLLQTQSPTTQLQIPHTLSPKSIFHSTNDLYLLTPSHPYPLWFFSNSTLPSPTPSTSPNTQHASVPQEDASHTLHHRHHHHHHHHQYLHIHLLTQRFHRFTHFSYLHLRGNTPSHNPH